MNNDTSRPQLPSDRAAEVAAVNAPTAAQNLGSKRGLKMLVRAQAASATQAPTRPVHRTASWPPTAPPEFGGEETGQQSAQSRRSPQSDLGQASSSSSHLPASALRAGPRQPLLRAPDSSDFDRLAGTSSRSSNQAPGCLSPIVSLLGTPLRPQVSVAASVRSEPALLPVSRDMGSPSACCYSILPSNIVTSAAITDQLDYLFVAFSTGAVRVYHIASGNTDREDRFGYVLYYQVSGKGGAHMGKCDVHIEIGSSTVGGLHQQASGGTSSSKHLFTAAKIGSTRMNVVDLDSLRESQRSRGFITTAGSHIKIFSKSDSRLRGFCSVSTVEYSLNSEGSVGEHRATPFYRGKYRLLCGKGFGSFTIWDVTLSHLPDTRSDGSVAGGMIGQYSDHWVVISTGSVGAPVLEFGFLSSNPLNYNSTEALVLGNEKKFLKIYNFTKPSHTNDMDNADTILMGGGRNLKTLCKNSLRILCSSADSLWMFGGLEELIVYRYDFPAHSAEREIIAEIRYSLTTEISGASGRHLRHLHHVYCTDDGAYAVLLCSDGAVLIYCLAVDFFNSGLGPTSSKCLHGNEVDENWKGFIVTWFQRNDQFSLQFGVQYKPKRSCDLNQRYPCDVMVTVAWMPAWGNEDKSAGVLRFEQLGVSMPASSVHYQPAFEISRTVVVPGIGLNHAIAIGAAITGRKCAVCNDVTEHWKASDMCELVSDSKCNDESGIDTDSGTECTEDDAQSIVSESAQTISKFSRKRTREKNSSEEAVVNSSPAGKKSKAVVSNQRPASANAMVSSLITEFTANPKSQIKAKIGKRPILQITDGYEAGHIAASSHHRLNIQNSSALPNISTSAVVDKELQAKILKLEAQLESSRQEMVASRQELDMVVRKGDRRFNEEMRLRKEWNSKMSEWMAEKADLVSQLRDYRERNELLKTESYNCLSVMSSLSGKLKALLRADHKGGDSSLGTSAISSMQDAQMSPGEQLRNYPKLFCVVCQSNTAEMVFSDCGHMCLCFEHFTIMNEAEYSIGGLKTCPVCKKRNNSVVRVRGLF